MKEIKEMTLFIGMLILSFLSGRMIGYCLDLVPIEQLNQFTHTNAILLFIGMIFLLISFFIKSKEL